MSVALSINLNRVALLRNSRHHGLCPSVAAAAKTVIDAGADGITVHPRPDERHITAKDVHAIADIVQSSADSIEFNIEGYPDQRLMDLVAAVRPDQCTLVPDAPDQATSDHGWQIRRQQDELSESLATLRELGVRSSLFIDPDPAQVVAAAEIGADRVELYTESYAMAYGTDDFNRVWSGFKACANQANAIGLALNAGHDLNLKNLPHFSALEGLVECSIGHAVVCDSVFVGLSQSVSLYKQAIRGEAVSCPWYVE